MELARDGFLVSDDPERLDFDVVQRLMESSYWASERPRAVTEASAKHSVCFGLYDVRESRQIGFMRVVTDHLTFAWLCDVIIDEAYRAKGLGRWMLQAVLEEPSLRDVRRWMLATRDAHEFYRDYGFTAVAKPEMWMERVRSRDGTPALAPPHAGMAPGTICYLQIPAHDAIVSAAFYEAVFGWEIERPYPSFASPGLIGQWVTDRTPAESGLLAWINVANIRTSLELAQANGGEVLEEPSADGSRLLARIRDPAGNTIGIVEHTRHS